MAGLRAGLRRAPRGRGRGGGARGACGARGGRAAARAGGRDGLRGGGAAVGGEPEAAEDCLIPFVSASEDVKRGCTVLKVEASDRPGVMRSLCWALNGLGLVVERAILKSEGGSVENIFFVTSEGGPVREPEFLVQHVEMVLQTCMPSSAAGARAVGGGGRLRQGLVTVDNEHYPDKTVITVRSGQDSDSPGLLLSLCSVLSAMRMQIAEAVVCRDCSDLLPAGSTDDEDFPPRPPAPGRTFRFHVQSLAGGPLDYEAAAAALFSLNLVISRRPEESTTPPRFAF